VKRASISEAKNTLSALLDRVKRGASVLIVDRGRPVARLEPISAASSDADGRLEHLVRDGIVRPARRPIPSSLFTTAPPRTKRAASAVQALIAERRESR
jgi:prevent-host-death family protein